MTLESNASIIAQASAAGVERLAAATVFDLVVASITGALVIHLVFLPLLRLFGRLISPLVFTATISVFFACLVYLQQHTKAAVDRFAWVNNFDDAAMHWIDVMSSK